MHIYIIIQLTKYLWYVLNRYSGNKSKSGNKSR